MQLSNPEPVADIYEARAVILQQHNEIVLLQRALEQAVHELNLNTVAVQELASLFRADPDHSEQDYLDLAAEKLEQEMNDATDEACA